MLFVVVFAICLKYTLLSVFLLKYPLPYELATPFIRDSIFKLLFLRVYLEACCFIL
jgi:hypothetical protein